jgi:aminomethyltransferase
MRRSPLHALSASLGARFVDFSGWEMPVQYQSVLAEHRAVRARAGWFDVSHLGRFSLQGEGSLAALSRLLTNDTGTLAPGRTQYNLLLNESGGIEDDLLVWRWSEELFWVLPNASTHDAVLEKFKRQAPGADLVDLRATTAMVAVQGPGAPAILEETVGSWPRRFTTSRLGELWSAGTGYTGEPGGEVIGDPQAVVELLERLGEREVVACGLGARDTLRLEAGLLLAGQDFDPSTNPYQAGLDWAISWNHDFVGRPALEAAGPTPARKLIGFTLPGRLIPRHGYQLRAGESVGEVTSGNFSPMLDCGIGLGYLSPPYREEQLEVEIRGSWEPGVVVEPPFYRR